MKAPLGFVLVFGLLFTTGCSAADHDFNSVVAGVEQRYSVHAQRIPLMGIISFCARATTHGGVKDMRVAEFEHIGNLDAEGLDSMMQSELGSEWQPMVKERNRAQSELSVIFVRPSDDSQNSMRMMIADYEHGELNLVRMEMNGSALAKWLQKPGAGGMPFHQGNPPSRQTD